MQCTVYYIGKVYDWCHALRLITPPLLSITASFTRRMLLAEVIVIDFNLDAVMAMVINAGTFCYNHDLENEHLTSRTSQNSVR